VQVPPLRQTTARLVVLDPPPDFISKISIVLEEADETLFWLELLVDADIIESRLTSRLSAECHELLKIFSASLATAKANR
jgi:four helix bundle protein